MPMTVEDSNYVKQRILFHVRLGKSFIQSTRCLAEESTKQVRVYKPFLIDRDGLTYARKWVSLQIHSKP